MIVIPDVHGRLFWKEAIAAAKEDEKIIFLGDYLDPYSYEFEEDPLMAQFAETYETRSNHVLNNFKEIIEFKRQNPDRVVLLLGNHDFHYLPIGERYSGYKLETTKLCSHILFDNIYQFRKPY